MMFVTTFAVDKTLLYKALPVPAPVSPARPAYLPEERFDIHFTSSKVVGIAFRGRLERCCSEDSQF